MNNFDEIIDAKLKLLMSDYYEFEALLKKLPEQVREETKNVSLEIQSLEKALKVVPDEFDSSFQEKINRILEITAEIEAHTKKLRNTLEIELPQSIKTELSNTLKTEIRENINNTFLISPRTLLLYGIISLFVGAGVLFLAFYLSSILF